MGSQSVTNFSNVRMKNIRAVMRDYYSPKDSVTRTQAKDIGAAAVALGIKAPASPRGQKGGGGTGTGTALRPANEFLQALSSPSVSTAFGLITSFADALKKAKDPERVYKKYGLAAEVQRPLPEISAFLTKAHSDSLSAIQGETESAFAAKDAIAKTVIDVVSRAVPGAQAAEVDREKLAEVFKNASREEIATAFMRNVASALINLVIDATRGKLSTAQTAELKQKVREEFVPEFIEQIKKGG